MIESLALAAAIGGAAYVVFRFVPPRMGGFGEAGATAPAGEPEARTKGPGELDSPHRNT